MVHLVQEAGEEGVGHVAVEEAALVHQDALDVLAEGRVLAQQLHTRLGQDDLQSHTLVGWGECVCVCVRAHANIKIWHLHSPGTGRAPSTVLGRAPNEEEVLRRQSAHLRSQTQV